MTTIQNTSVCAWVKSTSSTLALGGISHDTGNTTIGSCTLYSSGWQFSGNGSWTYVSGGTVANTSIWHHVCCTIDDTNIITYLDGIKVTTVTLTSKNAITNLTSSNFIEIGCDHPGGNEFLTGYVNDFRVYDHCLSAAEVHEISQGLVVHYKLDDNVQTITNAFNMGSWNTNTASGGFSVWGPSGHSGSRGTNTDRQYIYSPDRSYSYWIAHGANTDTSKYYIFYQSPAFDGGYRSLSCIVKEENSLPIDDAWFMPGWNANVVGEGHAPVSTWTHKYPLGNGFYLCQVDGFYQDGSNDLVCLTVNNGHKVYISEIWLENNRQVASNPLAQSTTTQVQDSSGYGHNGTIINTPSLVNSQARYTSNIHFSANNQHIQLPAITYSNFGNSFTIAWWGKRSTHSNMMFWGFSDGNRLNGMYNGTLWNTGDSSNNPIYKPGTTTTITAPTATSWHHYVMMGNGTKSQLYVDGVLYGEAKTYKGLTGTSIWINGWRNHTEYSSADMDISDFRIYCTVLSADDILSLYHTAAKVDNLGGLHTFEVIENIPNIIFKIDSARGAKVFQDGLSRYTQSQCQVTLTDEGYHIYRPPNLVYSSAGKVMWGGLKLVNQTSDTISPYNAARDNIWGLQKTHTYLFAFHAKGQSSNSPSLNVQNNMGWDRIAGMGPNPTYISTSTIPANFNGEKDCYIIFTINDDIIKTATKTEGGYTTGEQYLSYRDLSLNYGYTDTGALGTDLYLTDFRLYDITNYIGQIKKTGITNFSDYVERNGILQIRNKAELLTSNLIEH